MEVEVVVAHAERATLRVGGTFLKVDAQPGRLEAEVEAMSLAPVPTATVLWHRPPVLALAALSGTPLGRLGDPVTAPPSAWTAAGAAVRLLHDAPLPSRPGTSPAQVRADLDRECEALVAGGLLAADLVARNREVAEAALRPWTPAFVHGDLQIAHVFVDTDTDTDTDDDDTDGHTDRHRVSGILDWSEAGQGDPLHDLATLTLGHEDRLDDLLGGYGRDVDRDVDRDVVRGWWSARSLLAARWLLEHGFDPDAPGCEFDVLRARM